MMSFAKIKNQGKYYLDLASEDYYLEGGEPDGIWEGVGATLLNMKGTVREDHFRNVLKGYSPNGNEALCQSPGINHVPGWDLTFNAPKPVSVIWAGADDKLRQKIQDAQRRAVQEAISLLEKNAAFTRRGEKGKTRQKAEGLVVATFEHSTSREVDPHLHTHAILANIAPRCDGCWGTIDSRAIMLWQKAAGMVYKLSLADSMHDLGFETYLDNDAFGIKGVSKAICEEFSKRSKQITDALKDRKVKNRASASGDIASLSTRTKKGEVNRSLLFKKWQKQLAEMRFSSEYITSIRQRSENKFFDNEPLDAESLSQELTEAKSTFTKQEIFWKAGLHALEHGQSLSTVLSVANQVKNDVACELGKDWRHSELFTTRGVLETELSLIRSAKYLGSRKWAEIQSSVIDQYIKNQSIQLSDEQKFAVHNVCTESQFAILQGSAGAGKSASMRCVADIYQSIGKQVIGATVARAAANNLENEAGVKSYTIARLLAWLDSDKPPISEGGVLIVDEAGQVGTFQLEQLVSYAKKLNFKIILVGEDKQLDAIQHGGVLRYLSTPDVVGTTRVESIRRQNNAWDRQAVADFRDGYAQQALAQYQKRGQLHFESDEEKAKQQIIKEWTKFRHTQPDKQSLVIAHSWAGVVELNNEMRLRLQAEGAVGKENILIKGVVSDREIDVQISVGERVRFTKNEYKRNFTNGDFGTVTKVQVMADGDVLLRVKLDSGRETQFMASSYANKSGRTYITQAYAQTVYSSQGSTIDGDVFVYYSQNMGRAQSYVACSRHKQAAHIFVNEQEIEADIPIGFESAPRDVAMREALAKNMSRDLRPKLASEYLAEEKIELALKPKKQLVYDFLSV